MNNKTTVVTKSEYEAWKDLLTEMKSEGVVSEFKITNESDYSGFQARFEWKENR